MSAALDFYGKLEVAGKKVFILGDMLELGSDSKTLHEKIGELVVKQKLDKVIFVGKEMTYGYFKSVELKNKMNISLALEMVEYYDDESISKVAENIENSVEQGDLYFFKGSRGIKLERIADRLSEKVVNNEV